MKKPKIKMRIIKEDKGFSANTMWGTHFIATEGETFDELKTNTLEAVNLSFEVSGFKFTVEEILLEYDLASFLDFYKVFNASALFERIGMNLSLLAQYIKGIKRPSTPQTKRILQGVQQIGKELSEVRFLL